MPTAATQPASSGYKPTDVVSGDRSRLSGGMVALALMGPSFALLVVFFVLPLATLLLFSLYKSVPGGGMLTVVTTDNYTRFLTDALYYRVVWNSLKLGIVVTFWCLVLGFPLAYSIARTRSSRSRGVVIVLLLFPLMTSVVVRSYGWTILLGENGLINLLLVGSGLVATPVQLLYTNAGTVAALVEVLIPFMVLSLIGVIQNIDRSLERAAESLGANAWHRFVDVVLPLSMPGVAAGSVLIFILAIGSFVTPALIGGAKILVVPMLVYQQAMVVVDWPFASAISFIFLVVVLCLIGLQIRILERNRGRFGS
jgi:putative spermidine/putrescine transport system permease protein